MSFLSLTQPPLWERYQQQVKEWEQIVPRNNPAPYNGISEKSSIVEKPAMFAFCLKPRGLEVHSRGSKHRPQKKLHVGVLSNGIPADPDSFHPLGIIIHLHLFPFWIFTLRLNYPLIIILGI